VAAPLSTLLSEKTPPRVKWGISKSAPCEQEQKSACEITSGLRKLAAARAGSTHVSPILSSSSPLSLCELESTEISTNAILPLKTDTFALSQKVVPTAMMMYEPGGN